MFRLRRKLNSIEMNMKSISRRASLHRGEGDSRSSRIFPSPSPFAFWRFEAVSSVWRSNERKSQITGIKSLCIMCSCKLHDAKSIALTSIRSIIYIYKYIYKYVSTCMYIVYNLLIRLKCCYLPFSPTTIVLIPFSFRKQL